MINYSAAKLIKQSAAQIAYLTYKYLKDGVHTVPTKEQVKGVIHQNTIAKENKLSEELRGTLNFDDCKLHFCIDGYNKNDNIYYEIKSTNFKVEKWYYEQSVIQSIFLATAISKVSELCTPSFLIKKGYEKITEQVKDDYKFYLLFGKKKILIKPNSHIYDFYIRKLHIVNKCIIESDKTFYLDLLEAKKYDALYKFKDYELLIPKKYKRD